MAVFFMIMKKPYEDHGGTIGNQQGFSVEKPCPKKPRAGGEESISTVEKRFGSIKVRWFLAPPEPIENVIRSSELEKSCMD